MSLSKLAIPSRQKRYQKQHRSINPTPVTRKLHICGEHGKNYPVAEYFFASGDTGFHFFTGNGATSFF
jgi:hypothetical protein